MLYVIPELGTFATTIDEARETVAMFASLERGLSDTVEVWVINMPVARFLWNHWIGGKELPEPNLRMELPRYVYD